MLTVLIADDDRILTKLLDKALSTRGYKTHICNDGQEALQAMQSHPIDIAILDWYMPHLTGPEISEKQTLLENSKFIYKIILSGNLEKNNIIKALHKGAHDVMEKPCDLKLLESRLEMAGKMVREKRALENMAQTMRIYGEKMEQIANERAKQLIHADRMSSLGVMSAGVAHEINNPMSFISGNTQSIARFWKDLQPLLMTHPALSENQKLNFIIDEMPKALEGIMKGVERVTKIVRSLKKYSGKQDLEHKEQIDINQSIQSAIELCKSNFSKNTSFELSLADNIAEIYGNTLEVEQVLVNILVNASHAVVNKSNPKVSIKTYVENNFSCIEISDNGCGIPEKIIEKIWDPFVTTKPVGQGTGLGLSISNGIIKNHGGQILAVNLHPEGAKFQIKLPVYQGGVQI